MITDSAGYRRIVPSYTHSYLLVRPRPLIEPHGRLLVAPDVFVSESVLRSRGLFGTIPGQNLIAVFATAKQVGVTIDSIIFSDGEVVGPDQLPLISHIRARQAAAAMVVRCVRDARSSGNAPLAALKELSRSKTPGDQLAKQYRAMFIAQLMAAKNFDSILAALTNIPVPPRFFRKDGSEL